MKQRDFLLRLNADGIQCVLTRGSFRRWTFLDRSGSYYDPNTLTFDQDGLEKLKKMANETGTIHGPERTTSRQYYKIRGFYIVPVSKDRAEIFGSSKLRNCKYKKIVGA